MKTLKALFAAFYFLFTLNSLLHAEIPVVTNVVASQRLDTKLVDINYDLMDGDGDMVTIRIEISDNGGLSFNVPAFTFSGDIGPGVMPGTNKHIVWDASVDWDGEYSQQMRVKIIASDMRGFPELQFGMEVPPGGFLLGRDGGPEGIGSARHVNIPWSFWLSKYEITVGQFAEFLNTALAAGEVYREGNAIKANPGVYTGIGAGVGVYGLNSDIFWNLNKLDIGQSSTKLPVTVSWEGAIAFCQHYGYDLPTSAEWEKAARGPEHDGLGEHLIYPWGNTISGFNANYSSSGDTYANNLTPVGYYDGNQAPSGPDMANDYGLYDVIGNVAEHTRTLGYLTEDYPQLESLANALHSLTAAGTRVTRGGGAANGVTEQSLKCYGSGGSPAGFRVVRRSQ